MVAIPAIIQGAVSLAPLVEQAISLASSLAAQAQASGQMTPAQVQALWDSTRADWDTDWAAWISQQAAKIASKPPTTSA